LAAAKCIEFHAICGFCADLRDTQAEISIPASCNWNFSYSGGGGASLDAGRFENSQKRSGTT
jgi:hypothetical protein